LATASFKMFLCPTNYFSISIFGLVLWYPALSCGSSGLREIPVRSRIVLLCIDMRQYWLLCYNGMVLGGSFCTWRVPSPLFK
jgi:hypothetical protein